jgi:hypothetical protein
MQIELPTPEEAAKFGITSFKGIDVGLGQADKVAEIAAKLEEKYPMHLIFVQSGGWLQGYNRTAHVLHNLKHYKMQLKGPANNPHIVVGFPLAGYKRRLWSMINDYNTPYVVSLGTHETDRNVYVSPQGDVKDSLLSSVPDDIVGKIINELRQFKKLNRAGENKILRSTNTSEFVLKAKAEELDKQLTLDLMRLPRDARAIWGENVRTVMYSLMHHIFAYGLEDNKQALLNSLSADVDQLKHYLSLVPTLKKLKIAFEHRVSLAVEIGNLLGGVIRALKATVSPTLTAEPA